MSNEIEYDEIKYLHVSFVVEHLLPYLIDLLLISSRSLFWVRKSKTFDQNHCILWMQWMTKIGHIILENKVFRKLKLSKLFFTKNRGPLIFFLIRNIWMILDSENSLWKSDFGTFLTNCHLLYIEILLFMTHHQRHFITKLTLVHRYL